MNKLSLFVGIALGLVFSIFVVGIAFKVAAPSILLKEITSPYEFDKTLKILEDRLNAKEGWHVTDIIDQQEEIITHGGADTGKVKIIKFCNAKYASEMLSADEGKVMSTNMPLSISVYEKSDGRVMIGLSNGYMMARLFSGRREGLIMQKVVSEMEEVLNFTHFRFTIF
ncbi:hypothetical protein M947_07595 [Sulfurimonas hongkongensis]|uniref:DUF302 domain-containing protein n=1 Tax=Sulfurimonas hongkongensis TaxID=1172190 RepID=T0KQN3_9BACT|nr:DUF302 domain-containing protein [Sulfurimonas hongkongensis]EQB39314.1 hypothetical protein M947_07595 [Sulfurimonas hongkongensis]